MCDEMGVFVTEREWNTCERECVYKERDGKRENWVCFLFFFLWKFSLSYPFCPPNFWSQAKPGLNFTFGYFIYLFIHSPTNEHPLAITFLCLIFSHL